MKAKIYLAHPVSGDPVNNAMRATRWIRALTEKDPQRLYLAPWVAEVLGFENTPMMPEFYQRVLDDDCEVVVTCQGLLAVGGLWTPGMLQERAVAKIAGLAILDMTRYTDPNDLAMKIVVSEASTRFPAQVGIPGRA